MLKHQLWIACRSHQLHYLDVLTALSKEVAWIEEPRSSGLKTCFPVNCGQNCICMCCLTNADPSNLVVIQLKGLL